MRGTFLRTGTVLVVLALLAGCSRSGEPSLMNAARSSGSGPDEFAIVPNRPLEMPPSLAELPEPTPGGVNRASPQPRAQAVAALGGDPSRLGRTEVPAAEAALFARATRFGISEGIRDQLAAEDLEFRSLNRGRPLERLLGVNVYFRSYRPMALDRHAELERWRAAGVQTPAAPPPPQPDR